MMLFRYLAGICAASLALLAPAQTTWNFETGLLGGWTATGTAFNNQPTYGNVRLAGTNLGIQGNYWIGTFEDHHRSTSSGVSQGNGPMGTLTSAPFTISTNFISFLIGGTNNVSNCRVDLLLKLRSGESIPPFFAPITEPDGTYIIGALSTGRNLDVMRREVWDTAGALYQARTARIRILDNSAFGHINVDDFQFISAEPRKTIHVRNVANVGVAGAEVYLDGRLAGLTNASGDLVLSPPPILGQQLVARTRITEQSTYRHFHNGGSTHDWNYRVYQTSAPVLLNGQLSTPSTDANATQTLTVSPNNTLIGVHLLISAEWDANQDELNSLRDDVIAPFSQYLYNETDGQFFLERVEISDNSAFWDDADVRVHAETTLRSNVNRRTGGFLYDNILFGGTWMNLPRGALGWMGSGYVYSHEFGHYGMDVLDEYADNDDTVLCTMTSATADPTFGSTADRRACIMNEGSRQAKFCTGSGLNPHSTNTREGSTPCWDRIVSGYNTDPRWNIQSPTMRGFFPGAQPPLLQAWQPNVLIFNGSHPNLIQPYLLSIIYSDSRLPASMHNVHVRTTYGQDLFEGQTDDNGQILLSGLHVGDHISFQDGNHDLVVDGSYGPAAFARRATVGGIHPAVQGAGVVTVDRYAGKYGLRFVPNLQTGVAQINLDTTFDLANPPLGMLYVSGKFKSVGLKFVGGKRSYTATVTGLPVHAEGAIRIFGYDLKKTLVDQNFQFRNSEVETVRDTELFSTNGHLDITFPVGSVTKGGKISVSSWATDLSSLPQDMEVMSGPYYVTSTSGNTFKKSVQLRVQVPGGLPGVKRNNTYALYHYDEKTLAWVKVPAKYIPFPQDLVSTPVTELGGYVLMRPAATY